jgi:hypothetical protein
VAAEILDGLPATRKLTHCLILDFALTSNFLWANLTLFAIPSENGGVRPPLQPDALAKARAAYQDFLTLWNHADPDVPILKQAKVEYARLQ